MEVWGKYEWNSCYTYSRKSNILSLSLSHLYPLIWRFLPVLDPEVDLIFSRDLDSVLSERESAAIQGTISNRTKKHLKLFCPQRLSRRFRAKRAFSPSLDPCYEGQPSPHNGDYGWNMGRKTQPRWSEGKVEKSHAKYVEG